MKRILSALVALVCLAFTGIAQECPYDIKWLQGQGYSTASEIKDMKVISLRMVFAEINNVSSVAVSEGKKVHVEGPNNFTGDFYISQLSKADQSGNVINLNGFKFTCESKGLALKEYGDYTMTFPAGFMKVDGTDNPQFSVKFTIEDTRVFEPIEFQITNVSPAEGEVTELRSVSFQISNKNSLDKRIYDNLGLKAGSRGLVEMPDGSTKDMLFAGEGVLTDKLGWEFRFYKEDGSGNIVYEDGLPVVVPFTEPGDYRFIVPEGTIRLSEIEGGRLYTNKRIEFNYTIKGSVPEDQFTDEKPVANPVPDKTYKSLERFEFSAPANYSIALPSSVKNFSLIFDGKQSTATPSISNGIISVSFGKIEAKGSYVLRIPEGAIEFSDADGKKYINRTIEFNYNVDPAASVEMIEADGKVTVYNLAGERVLDNAPADMLRNLEKGIYIVNGKKQAVK